MFRDIFLVGGGGPDWKTKITCLADLSTKVTHCTQVHDIWPIGPLV